MLSSEVGSIVSTVSVVLGLIYYWIASATERQDGMPPGPPTRFLVGNDHQLQAQSNHSTPLFFQYQAYQAQYGDLISVKNGTINVIILQSARLVRELLDERPTIYSNRPISEFQRLLRNGNDLLFQRDHKIWGFSSREIAIHYSTARCEKLVYLQEAESVQILWEFAASWRNRRKLTGTRPTSDPSSSTGLGWGSGFGVVHNRDSTALFGTRRNGGMPLDDDLASDATPSLMTDEEEDSIDPQDIIAGHPLLHSFVRYAYSVLASDTYGIRAPTYDSPLCKGVQDRLNSESDLKYSGTIPPIDAFPFLNWIPDYFSPWRVRAKTLAASASQLYRDFYQKGVMRGIEGRNEDSFAYHLHKRRTSHKLTDEQVHSLCGLVLEAGPNAVAIAITVCMMALIENPQLQRIAQREIDAVCDDQTLPTWRDKEDLHYIVMLVKESLRWRPPFPLGAPHSVAKDDYFSHYFLPRGSTVVANIWAIHQDPDRYPNPEIFDPERYRHDKLPMAESVTKEVAVRDHLAFGAGRRSCPGVQLAEQGIFLAIARVLWAFNISVPPDYVLDVSQETGFFGHDCRQPKDFPLMARPRSVRRLDTIEREMKTANRFVFPLFATS